MLREFSKTDWYGFSGAECFIDYGRESQPLLGEAPISIIDWPHMNKWLKESEIPTDEYKNYMGATIMAAKDVVSIGIGDQWWHLDLEGKPKGLIVLIASVLDNGQGGKITRENLEGLGFERII